MGFRSCGVVAPRYVRSFCTRDLTHVPCISRWIFNQWTAGEVPINPVNAKVLSVPKRQVGISPIEIIEYLRFQGFMNGNNICLMLTVRRHFINSLHSVNLGQGI